MPNCSTRSYTRELIYAACNVALDFEKHDTTFVLEHLSPQSWIPVRNCRYFGGNITLSGLERGLYRYTFRRKSAFWNRTIGQGRFEVVDEAVPLAAPPDKSYCGVPFPVEVNVPFNDDPEYYLSRCKTKIHVCGIRKGGNSRICSFLTAYLDHLHTLGIGNVDFLTSSVVYNMRYFESSDRWQDERVDLNDPRANVLLANGFLLLRSSADLGETLAPRLQSFVHIAPYRHPLDTCVSSYNYDKRYTEQPPFPQYLRENYCFEAFARQYWRARNYSIMINYERWSENPLELARDLVRRLGFPENPDSLRHAVDMTTPQGALNFDISRVKENAVETIYMKGSLREMKYVPFTHNGGSGQWKSYFSKSDYDYAYRKLCASCIDLDEWHKSAY